MNLTTPKPMQIRNTKLKKEKLQLKIYFKKKIISCQLGIAPGRGLQLNGSVAVWKARMVIRAPWGHEKVTGAGSTQGFLQWSLAGAGIFH